MSESAELFAREVRRSKRTQHEDALDYALRALKLPPFVREFPFGKGIGRRWRFDFAFLEPWKIAIEVEGLVVRKIGGRMVSTGAHANITGFREDCEKYAWAAILGWTVLRFEQHQAVGEGLELIERLFASRGWKR